MDFLTGGAARENTDPRQPVYIFAYFILHMKYFLDYSSLIRRPEAVDTALVAVFLVSVGLKLLSQRYTVPRLIATLGLLALCAYSARTVGFSLPFSSLLLLVSLQDVDLRAVLRVSSATKFIALAVHVIGYAVTYIVNPTSIHYVYRGGVRRHYFFLGHANMFTAFLTWASLELIYVHREKLRWPHLLLLWLVNLVFYQFTDSNTGLIVLTMACALLCVHRLRGGGAGRLLTLAARYGFAFCAVFFPLTCVAYPYLSGGGLELWERINQFQTGRLQYGAYAYDVYGASLLGRKIQFPEKVYWEGFWMDSIVFDNSYLWLFVIFGSVYLVLLSAAFFRIAKRLDPMDQIMVVTYVVYGVMENYVFNVVVCFPLLLIGKHLLTGRDREPDPPPVERGPVPLWKQRSA